jgi:hypothetical protein
MRLAVVLSLAAVVVTGITDPVSVAARPTTDPPIMVPWSKVGSISLGEPRAAVYRAYGAGNFHVLQRWGHNTQGYFRLHSSRLVVTFYGRRVGEIGFTTTYYRTTAGFGVGSTIPLGPCHHTPKTNCERRWHGFVYNEWNKGRPCQCWVKVGTRPMTREVSARNFNKPWYFIYTTRGRVSYFYFAAKFVD